MNTFRLEAPVTYRKSLGILMTTLGAAVLLGLGTLLGPLRKHLLDLKHRETDLLLEIQSKPTLAHLESRMKQTEERHQAMAEAERQWKDRVNTLGDEPSRFSGNTEEDLRIDYKVALFNTLERLKEQAARQQVRLPDDLGVPETIDEGEVAVVRLWQLETVEKLLMHCTNLGVPAIKTIETLPTLSRNDSNGGPYPHHEFPVRLTADIYPAQAASLLQALQQEGAFFTLRRFSAERALLPQPERDVLEVTLVASAKLFQPLTPAISTVSQMEEDDDDNLETFDVLDL